MHLIGRYERIRAYGREGFYGPPYILDRKWTKFLPVKNSEEWWRSPEGAWVPTVSGGIGFQGANSASGGIKIGDTTGNSWAWTTTALSNTYTAGSAGNSCALRYIAPGSLTLNNIYFFIASYTGTASLVDDINYEVRTGTITGPTTTGGALLGSGTKNPSSATGWINISGLSIAVSAGYNYFIIADADGSGTNFANVNRSYANTELSVPLTTVFSTTNGYSTPTGTTTARSNIVLVFSNGLTVGSSITAQSTVTNNTARRGLYIDGVVEPLKVSAWMVNAGNANISGIELYPDPSTPGTGSLASSTTLISPGTTVQGAVLSPSYPLARNTPYRFVFTFSGNTTVCRKLAIGTGSDTNLKRAMPYGYGLWYYAYANGTTDWSNDDTTAYPDMILYAEDQDIGGMLHGDMSGGML